MNPFTSKLLMDSDPEIPSFKPFVTQILNLNNDKSCQIPIFDNFNKMYDVKKLQTLRNIMGLNSDFDPDEDKPSSSSSAASSSSNNSYNFEANINYQITVDNALKLIAIYLRFVANIPVVIMGETGCGKTRLVRFFADLYRNEFKSGGRKMRRDILIHVKVHGGMTANEIVKYVEEAERMAELNYEMCTTPIKITCILFFDEANTTEHVGMIKEIMCDGTLNGRKINVNNS